MRTLLLLLISASAFAQPFSSAETASWREQAKHVTIIRDNWGIPHIYGKTDADAVFGMLYAQCENDFERVEQNYINTSARRAEADGEEYIYDDLRMRLFIDTAKVIALYKEAPAWMKKICQGFADGANYYLYTHPGVQPKLLKRFQPWMPLLFSEGSIGGDIESVSLNGLKEFYGKTRGDLLEEFHDDGNEPEPRGSNGFAIAPINSASGKALLLINPHTSFYFRSELQVTSEEGLNAYGAVTWGQFFIYQGFNAKCGWMHTSSAADVIDEFKESVVKRNDSLYYKHGKTLKPLPSEKVTIKYRTPTGPAKKEFVVYRTQHGPVIAQRKGKWISVRLMVDPLNALTQSYKRTKANGLEEFTTVMQLRTNSSNNTVYADNKGNIAYWHGNYMPRRSTKFDWSQPVDGSDPATDWNGLHDPSEMIHLVNPPNGWIQNCNSTPFTAAAESSPDRTKYPSYMAPDAQNARGIHADRVLRNEKAFTLDRLISAAYDSWLPGFEKLIPSLVAAWDNTLASDSLKTQVSPAIGLLRSWDLRFSTRSVETTLAIDWALRLRQNITTQIPFGIDQLSMLDILAAAKPTEKMLALSETMRHLKRDFGTWNVAWGDINRFQRLTGKIEPVFDDQKPSIAVPFTSSLWGSLAAFGSRLFPNTKRMYGYVGNSFVAVVEFGDRVKAKSVVTGGESSDPSSTHFNDQATRYCEGQFKDILFYREDVRQHAEKTYHPGE